jgi:methionyl-tRNA formyltransferase
MKKVTTQKICLCGEGWGALAALDAISLKFYKIVVVSDDENIINNAKSRGFQVERSIFEANADVYVCSGFTKILDKSFLDSKVVLNIHYSLLPKYRGLHSTVWSLLNDEPYFGLTIHLMNEFIDDGPILHQYKFENTGQNSREIMEACNQYIAKNFSQILDDFLTSKIKLIPQDKNEATWVCRRNLDDCLVDFEKPINYLALFFRALVEPYPLPRVKTERYSVEIVRSELIKSDYNTTNGRVVNIELGRVWIKTLNGFLIVSEIRDCTTKSALKINDVFKIGMRLK